MYVNWTRERRIGGCIGVSYNTASVPSALQLSSPPCCCEHCPLSLGLRLRPCASSVSLSSPIVPVSPTLGDLRPPTCASSTCL